MRLHRAGLVFALVLGTFALSAWGKPLVAKSVKVYKGPEGVRMTVVRLQAKGEALVQVTGTDTDIDGNVFKVDIREWGDNQDWTTYEMPIGKYVLVTRRAGVLELYTPGKQSAARMTYDEKASDEAQAEPLITLYEAAHQKPAKSDAK